MKKLGINVVRMGEFAWSVMEPYENVIDVSFFVEVINKLNENGISTIICTPTATPPIWVSYGHSERMYKDNAGIVIHGARQHVCTNNPYFHKRTKIIVEALAEKVGNLPGVIGWQIDNEFKCNVAECYCEECEKLWHEWLEKRYETIENLNIAWATHVWSQYYQSFEQVPVPLRTTFLHNPSLSTMYRLFSREKIVEYLRIQTDIIRKHSKAPITHNSSVLFMLNNEAVFEELDFASFDDYPEANDYRQMVFDYDRFRCMKNGYSFMVMETCSSHSGFIEVNKKIHPDEFVKAESVCAYAMGAFGFSYWLFRQHKSGCEIPHGAIISSWGEPAIGYRQVEKATAAMREIENQIIMTVPVKAEIALHYSDIARAFMMTEPLENMDYYNLMRGIYDIILDSGFHRDIIGENAKLDEYKIVITPFIYYLSDELLNKALSFVEKGGIWIVGPLTGMRTKEHTVHTDSALGRKFESAAGVKVLFSYPIKGTACEGEAFGIRAPLSLWSHFMQCNEAKKIGNVVGGETTGLAFITERDYGEGKIISLGALPSSDEGKLMLSKLFAHYAGLAGVRLKFENDVGIVSIIRVNNEGNRILMSVDMGGKGGKAKYNKTENEIEPYGYSILNI